MLLDEVCKTLLPASAGCVVADVRVGLGYTAVQLDNGHCGLAYTFRDDIQEGCSVIKAAGTLVGQQASELAAWARSPDPLAASVGLATLNALVPAPPDALEAGLLSLLEIALDDVVGMVGFFGPLIEPLRTRCRSLYVFERRPSVEPWLLPESSAVGLLPQCGIVILSATALLNRSIDGLLAVCRNAHEIVILGPSTPLLPQVFADRGVTWLCGVHVVDPKRVLRLVSEGGGTRHFGSAVRKLTVRCVAGGSCA